MNLPPWLKRGWLGASALAGAWWVAKRVAALAISGADMGGNLSTIKDFLDRVYDTGHIGDLLMVGIVVVAAVIVVSSLRKAGPFRIPDALAAQAMAAPAASVSETSPIGHANTQILFSKRLGSPPIKAIGVINSISIRFLNIGGDFRFECAVDVEVAGLSQSAEWSPFSLRLTDRDAKEELAILSVPHGVMNQCPGQVRYQGRGSWSKLTLVAAATMDGLDFPFDRGPWHLLPPAGPLFCDLELHLPPGKEGYDHQKSQARLAFEIRGMSFQRVTARIDPWNSEDQAVTTTLL